MANAAIVILAGTDGHENSGRLVNGLEAAKEFAETEGDEVELIFDGAGTQWIPELEDEDSDYLIQRESPAVHGGRESRKLW